MKCEICEEELIINLIPDFSASGFWCKNCGVSLDDPQETFTMIPQGLLVLVEGWVLLWDILQFPNQQINKDYFEKLIRRMGIELCRQINKYYMCYFDTGMTVFIDEE